MLNKSIGLRKYIAQLVKVYFFMRAAFIVLRTREETDCGCWNIGAGEWWVRERKLEATEEIKRDIRRKKFVWKNISKLKVVKR